MAYKIKRSSWKKVHSTFYENPKRDEAVSVTATGKGGILGKNYQRMYGYVAELNSKNGSQRSVFDTKKEAVTEIKRYMRTHK
jgi:hypothetical protein